MSVPLVGVFIEGGAEWVGGWVTDLPLLYPSLDPLCAGGQVCLVGAGDLVDDPFLVAFFGFLQNNLGGWVGVWVGWVEENEAVRMRCCELGVGWS